jgi:hypothetical protein
MPVIGSVPKFDVAIWVSEFGLVASTLVDFKDKDLYGIWITI